MATMVMFAHCPAGALWRVVTVLDLTCVKFAGRLVTMKTPKPTLAEALRSARERQRYSKVELAAVAGISPSTISRIELGQRTRCSGPVLSALAKALGISIESLIDPPAKRRDAA